MQILILILEILDIWRQALSLHEFLQALVFELAFVLELDIAFLEGFKGG